MLRQEITIRKEKYRILQLPVSLCEDGGGCIIEFVTPCEEDIGTTGPLSEFCAHELLKETPGELFMVCA